MIYQIDKLLGSKTRAMLLTKIMMNPDKSFYVRELAKELEIPYSMIYKEKNTLLSLGILKEEKRGKINILTVNRNLSYFPELKSLVMKTTGIAGVLSNILGGIEGVRYALIYGSFANGKETSSSDVDLLIVGDVDEEKILEWVSEAEKRVGREINYILWKEEEFNNRIVEGHHLLINIGNGDIVMIVGSEDEFRTSIKG